MVVWSVGKYRVLSTGKLEKLCPFCDAVLDDSLQPVNLQEINTVRITIGKRKPIESPCHVRVGKIRCPSCGKLIDVFIKEN